MINKSMRRNRTMRRRNLARKIAGKTLCFIGSFMFICAICNTKDEPEKKIQDDFSKVQVVEEITNETIEIEVEDTDPTNEENNLSDESYQEILRQLEEKEQALEYMQTNSPIKNYNNISIGDDVYIVDKYKTYEYYDSFFEEQNLPEALNDMFCRGSYPYSSESYKVMYITNHKNGEDIICAIGHGVGSSIYLININGLSDDPNEEPHHSAISSERSNCPRCHNYSYVESFNLNNYCYYGYCSECHYENDLNDYRSDLFNN